MQIDDTRMSQGCGWHLISTTTVRALLRDLELPHFIFGLNDGYPGRVITDDNYRHPSQQGLDEIKVKEIHA